MLKKSKDLFIRGIVALVKASISRGRPGTAADMSLELPMAMRISASNFG